MTEEDKNITDNIELMEDASDETDIAAAAETRGIGRYYGNTVQHWRCGMDTSIVSETETTISFSCVCFAQSLAWGYDVYMTGYASIDGKESSSGLITFTAPSGSTTIAGLIRHNSTTYTKGHSARNISASTRITNQSGYHNGTSTASTTLTIPAKKSWSVSYNANGGSGAPGNQTKWYGERLTLATARPARTGHNFLYWTTDFGSGSVRFYPGGAYDHNRGATLYANWQAHTYTVSYNANGGSGAPGAQTKTYGQTLKLSSVVPKRTNYNFKGWATSASGGVSYQPGGSYTNNSAVTLYAVWELAWREPRITNLKADRCNSAGTLTDEGQYAKVSFNWATDRTISSIKIVCNGVTTNASGSGTSGSVSVVVGANALSTENQYTVNVTVTDAVGGVTISTTVAPMNYIMDIASNGSVAFGGPSRAVNSRYKSVEFYTPPIYYNRPPIASNEISNSGSSAGYVKIITFTNASGATYSNSSIEIKFAQRSRYVCTIMMHATNVNSNAITIQGITGYSNSAAFSNNSVYYRQPANNIIEIWVKKTENYDVIRVLDVRYDRFYMSYLTYDTTQTFGTSVPSGYKAVGIRSLLGVSVAKQNGYYGMTLADGTDADWYRTTSNGIIPYKAGGASNLGTETWPFNNVYTSTIGNSKTRVSTAHINAIEWGGNGLRGRVMKTIWTGSCSIGGTITCSEFPYYNFFAATISDWTTIILGAKLFNTSGASNYIRFSHGYDSGTKHEVYFASFNQTTTTKWGFIGGCVHNMSSNTVSSILPITKIYGIL